MTAQTARDAVELVPLNDTTWRVCDARNGGDGVRKILGYLTAIDEQYEMLWMRPRAGVTRRYDTYEDAVEAIATRLRSME